MYDYIIGIDEAGRGPLAGSVYVGGVLLPYDKKEVDTWEHIPSLLSDSKKLSQKRREEWFEWMKEHDVTYTYSWTTPSVIDRINIRQAVNASAQRVYSVLIKGRKGSAHVIADGGIDIAADHHFENFPKADETVPVVSLASIVAKVMRDRVIVKMGERYPEYGFDQHKGYGTKAHITALQQHGPCTIHRKTFIKTHPPHPIPSSFTTKHTNKLEFVSVFCYTIGRKREEEK
jgi:ribonuclease HII